MLDNYYVIGISTIFSFVTSVKFSLFVLSKEKSEYIKTGVYNTYIKLKKMTYKMLFFHQSLLNIVLSRVNGLILMIKYQMIQKVTNSI